MFWASGRCWLRGSWGTTPVHDFGARILPPAIPFWTTPDPCAERYYHLGPYTFCAADPINHSDPNGCTINMYNFIGVEKLYNYAYSQLLVEDWIEQTGLSIFIDENCLVQYAKDDSGKPIIAKTTNSKGEQIDAGSKTARDFLINVIDNNSVINVFYSNTGSNQGEIGIKLDPQQITEMIQGAVGVDGKTLGFGMTMLHELYHTPIGGNLKDNKSDEYGTGPVVDNMNQIRRELNAQGFNYGQRMTYKAYSRRDGNITPFNDAALSCVKNYNPMNKKAYYIRTKNKK